MRAFVITGGYVMNIIRRKKLAQLLDVSIRTIIRWEDIGRLPVAKKIGPRIVGWPEDEIKEFIAALSPRL